jgi:hypothetical protein
MRLVVYGMNFIPSLMKIGLRGSEDVYENISALLHEREHQWKFLLLNIFWNKDSVPLIHSVQFREENFPLPAHDLAAYSYYISDRSNGNTILNRILLSEAGNFESQPI